MKTKRAFSLGFAAILAMIAVIGFTACSDDASDSGGSGGSPSRSVSSSFVGTWAQYSYTLTINSDCSWTSSFTTAMEYMPSVYDLYTVYDSSSGYLYLYVSYSGTSQSFGYCKLQDSNTLIWDASSANNLVEGTAYFTMTKQ